MKITNKYALALGLLLCISSLKAQITTQIETSWSISNDRAPFWMVNNQQGLESLQKENGYLRARISHNMIDSANNWDYRYGIDLIETRNYPSSFIIQQLYADLRYKKMILSIGSKERWGILKNPDLSCGGMSWSGNSRPIPQARLETDGYLSYPWLLNNQLKINASISYGIQTDPSYIKQIEGSSMYNILYHNKTLILQYDIPHTKWSSTVGLESHAQFGERRKDLKQFLMIFIQSQGDGNSSDIDQLYMFGSTRGSWHIKQTYNTDNYKISAYLENFFDDFSGMAKQNRLDGLWGVEYIKTDNKIGINGIVLEYLQTTDQSGPNNWVLHDHTGTQLLVESPTGNDNYYWSSYNKSWTHWGMVNGNPLLTSPIYFNLVTGIYNNRVKAVNLGISAQISKTVSTRVRTTYSQGWGTYFVPFDNPTDDYMSLIELNYSPLKLKRWNFTIAGALDRGNLYGNNSGLNFKIRYRR